MCDKNIELTQSISFETHNPNHPSKGNELFGVEQTIEELPALRGIVSIEPRNKTITVPTAAGFRIISDKLFSDLPVFKCDFSDDPTTYPFISDSNFVFNLAKGEIKVPTAPNLRLDLCLGLLAASCLPIETAEAFSEIVEFYSRNSKNVDVKTCTNINNAISYATEDEIAFSLMPDFDEPSRLRGAFLLSGILNLLPQKNEKRSLSKLLKKLNFKVDSSGNIPREIEIVDEHYRVIKDRLSDPRLAITNL